MSVKATPSRSVYAHVKNADNDKHFDSQGRRIVNTLVQVEGKVTSEKTVPSHRLKMALVLDRSGSMDQRISSEGEMSRLALLKQSTNFLVDSIGAHTQMGIVTFGSSAVIESNMVNVGRHREQLKKAVEMVRTDGCTNLFLGMQVGANMLQGKKPDHDVQGSVSDRVRQEPKQSKGPNFLNRFFGDLVSSAKEADDGFVDVGKEPVGAEHKVMVILTDGMVNEGVHNIAGAMVKDERFDDVEVFVIGMSKDADHRICQSIARVTGGEMMSVVDEDGIAGALGSICGTERLATQVRVALQPCSGGEVSIRTSARASVADGQVVGTNLGTVADGSNSTLLLQCKVPTVGARAGATVTALTINVKGVHVDGSAFTISLPVDIEWSEGSVDGEVDEGTEAAIMREEVSQAINTANVEEVRAMCRRVEASPYSEDHLAGELQLMQQLQEDFAVRSTKEMGALCAQFSEEASGGRANVSAPDRYNSWSFAKAAPSKKAKAMNFMGMRKK